MAETSIFEKLEASGGYDTLRSGVNRQLVKFFLQNAINGQQEQRVLEIACGTGEGANLLARERSVALSVAADIDLTMFERARYKQFRATFVQGDIFRSAFQPESFDLVWNSSSLEHFDNPELALTEMTNLTKVGGRVFVGVPHFYGPLALYHCMPFHSWREWIGKPFKLKELEALFTRCGLQPKASLVYFFRFFVGLMGEKIASSNNN